MWNWSSSITSPRRSSSLEQGADFGKDMPLTDFQKKVMTVIAANRSERSHIAGGLILHGNNKSARYSHDFDIFHDEAEDVAASTHRPRLAPPPAKPTRLLAGCASCG